MTSERPEDLTQAQTDAVRRALRAARHDGPLPAEVAARLDATLAGLVADRASGEAAVAAAAVAPADEPAGAARVVPLRRRWPALLAAAAAVIAIGLAGTQLMDRSAHDSATHPAADSAGKASSLAEGPEDTSAEALDRDLSTLEAPAAPVQLTAAQRAALADAGYHNIELAPTLAAGYSDGYRSAAKALRSDRPERTPEDDGRAVPVCALSDRNVPAGVEPTYYEARRDAERVVLVVLPGPEVTAYPCDGGKPTPLPLD